MKALPVTAFTLTAAISLSVALPAYSYEWPHGFTSPIVRVNGRQNLSANALGACQFAHDVWNATPTRVDIGWNDATPVLVLRFESLSDGTMGLYRTTSQFADGHAATAVISVDAVQASANLPGKWSAKIQGVYAHELGHALNLGDQPNTGRVSLMKYSTQGLAGGYYWPQPYDIEDVNRIFP